jgi:hypothetical protein
MNPKTKNSMPIMAIGGIPFESARLGELILTSSIIFNQVYTANIGSDCQKNSTADDFKLRFNII